MNKNGILKWSMGFIFIGGGERQQTKRVQRLRAGGRVVGAGWPNHLWAGWHGLHRVGWGVGVAVKAKEIVKHLIRPSATLLKFIPKAKSLRLPPLRPTGSETLMVGPAISVLQTLRLTMAHICSRSPVKVSSLQNHLLGFTRVPLNSFLHTAVDLKPPGPKSI